METKKVASIDPTTDTQAPFKASRVDFFPTKIGKESTFTTDLVNKFDYPIILHITCSSDQYRISSQEIKIAPGKSKSFSITFAPKKEGTWFGMVVFHQLPGGDMKFFTVIGKGVK